MREPLFIKKNIAKWQEFDAFQTDNPDELSERFTKVLDDLSYAQTFYPKGKTVQYLNERAVRFYNQIYKKKKESFQAIKEFWTVQLPLVLYRNQKLLLIAFLIFAFSIFIGFMSALYDPTFMDVISPGYVDATLRNIKRGDPFGVYNDSGATFMFLRIGLNNIFLAFVYDFIGGIFFGITSIYSTFLNGVMVGSFFHLFYNANLGAEFFLVVMIHGTFELFALVLAVAAGFRLFHSAIFIGTYTRTDSIRKGFKEGMQIMILVFILLFVAAFLESYITRLAGNSLRSKSESYTFMPIWASITVLVTCTAIILWYFIFYPIIVNKRVNKKAAKLAATENLGKVYYAHEVY